MGKYASNKGLIIKSVLIIFLLVLFSWTFNLDSVRAVGLIIKPTKINISAQARKEAAAEFLVVNIEPEPAIYKISPDAFASEVKLEPMDFQLEPNASQLVKVKVKFGDPGRYHSDISVIARPMGAGELTLASGVKLPLTIEVGGLARWQHVLGLVSLLIICLLAVFGVKWIVTKRNKDSL